MVMMVMMVMIKLHFFKVGIINQTVTLKFEVSRNLSFAHCFSKILSVDILISTSHNLTLRKLVNLITLKSQL